jgi:hypothetical protein
MMRSVAQFRWVDHEIASGEPRYLLVLPLFGAAITLAIRGPGRR